MTGKKWTKEEIKFMIEHHLDYSLAEMSARVGHPKSSILTKIHDLGYTWRRKKIENRKFWTSGEEQFLKENYGEIPTRKIAEKLDRTFYSVRNRLTVLNLFRYTRIQISTSPEFHLTEEEASYLAGIIDGEGSLSIPVSWRRKEYPGITISLSISNTNLELIEWIQEKLNLQTKYRKRVPQPGSKTTYSIQVSHRAHLKIVLSRILSYLIVKRELAIQVLKIIELKKQGAFDLNFLQTVLKFKEQVDSQNIKAKKSVERLKKFIKKKKQ